MSDYPDPEILDVVRLPDGVTRRCQRWKPADGGPRPVDRTEPAKMERCRADAEYVFVFNANADLSKPRRPKNCLACRDCCPTPNVDDAPARPDVDLEAVRNLLTDGGDA